MPHLRLTTATLQKAPARASIAWPSLRLPPQVDFVQKLELLAGFFASLQPIPIAFRPWHEFNLGWAWWGSDAATADEFIALWRSP